MRADSGRYPPDSFAYPACKEMLTLLQAFSPLERRQLAPPDKQTVGVARNPQSRIYEDRTVLTWTISEGGRARSTAGIEGAAPQWGRGFEEIHDCLRRAFGPEGIKHFMAVLIALDAAYRKGQCKFDTDRHLDALGYKRRAGGYHHPANAQAARATLGVLTSLCVEQSCVRDRKPHTTHFRVFAVHAEEPTFDPSLLRWDFDRPTALSEVRPVRGSVVILANPWWYHGVLRDGSWENGRQFTRQLRKIAREDARRHGITLLLGTLLPIKWRMKKGPVRVRARNLMAWGGLDPSGRDRQKALRRLRAKLDYMQGRGYLGQWQDTGEGIDDHPFEHVYEISPPAWLFESVCRSTSWKIQPEYSAERGDLSASELRQIRQAAGMGLGDLAPLVGCSKALLSMAESGKRRVTPELAEKVRAALWESPERSQD